MNPVNRTWRYVRAYAGLEGLNRRTAGLVENPAELIAQSFNYSDAFLQPLQIQEELACLVKDVTRLKPRSVLEIGTFMGGTLYLWTRLATDDATIVSVDLPGGKFGGGYSSLRTPIYRRFARRQQQLHLIRGSSHDRETFERVRGLFGERPVDFLFIDGDHTFEGVRRDWEMYSPLVREGGLIGFHDVAGNYDDTQVKRFWDSIKDRFHHREYMVHAEGLCGIGVLFK